MVIIELIELGDIYPVNFRNLQEFGNKSEIMEILGNVSADYPEILDRENIKLNNDDLSFLINIPTKADFRVIIVNENLEGDYFTRIINDNLIVLSIYDIEVFQNNEGISADMFVMRFLYLFAVDYQVHNKLTHFDNELLHNKTIGCLFDKCIYKPHIVLFFRDPKISAIALKKLQAYKLPHGYIRNLKKEIGHLKIGMYYRLTDWLKENPLLGLLITFLFGLFFSEILGNYLYDLISGLF